MLSPEDLLADLHAAFNCYVDIKKKQRDDVRCFRHTVSYVYSAYDHTLRKHAGGARCGNGRSRWLIGLLLVCPWVSFSFFAENTSRSKPVLSTSHRNAVAVAECCVQYGERCSFV